MSMAFDSLVDSMREILRRLDENGFVLPFYIAMIGSDGSSLTGYFYQAEGEEHLDCKFTSVVGENFTLPVNIMFTDKTGKAARVVIESPGEPSEPHFFN